MRVGPRGKALIFFGLHTDTICIAWALSPVPCEEGRIMRIADTIKQALAKKGFHNLKDAAESLDISPELLRVTINKGHIPKDNTLSIIAQKLGLDETALILAAHQEKVPDAVKGFFLSPTPAKERQEKRIFPLSQEQCDYLGKIMRPEEIQIIRQLRQVSEEGKTQIIGYVEYTFATKRKEVRSE
jgi:hypothetical protein